MGPVAGPSAVAARQARVVCPFTPGGLIPECQAALADTGLSIEWEALDPADPFAYGRLFQRLWTEGRTFVICEHDVAPTFDQLYAICSCGHPWCSFAYDDGMYPDGPTFGLARFDSAVMCEWPLAAQVALVVGKRRDEPVEWWRVDSMVARDLMIRRVPWVEHRPAVRHLHPGPPSGPL